MGVIFCHKKEKEVPAQVVRSLLPVYISWTSGVNQREGQALVQGVKDVIAVAGQNRETKVFGARCYGQGDFSSPDWYQEQAIFCPVRERHGFGPQADASKIISLMQDEPWQRGERHLDVMLVDKDISSSRPGINFVFGTTQPGFGFVQSIIRLRSVRQNLRLRLIRRTARHEFAHVLQVPSRTYRVEENLGRHCTNVCCLRQGLSLSEWEKHLLEEERAGVVFCQDCLVELQASQTD